MAKAKVAILRTKPETVVDDYRRLCELGGVRDALDPSAATILKDNITWHVVFPGVNTSWMWEMPSTYITPPTANTPLWAIRQTAMVLF